MKKIITTVRPFIAKQNVYVYDGSNKIAFVTPKLTELYDTLFALCEKYEVVDIGLTGPKQYLNGVISTFKEKEMQKYSENKINIYII